MLFIQGLFKRRGVHFIRTHLIAALIFAIVYYISDLFLHHYPKTAEKVGFGKKVHGGEPFTYWLYFSLATQSTVGYGGIEVYKNGSYKPYQAISSYVFKALNLLQLISVFVITGYYI
jgi:hypothetical protein